MRLLLTAILALSCAPATAFAQATPTHSAPAEIGNRANGNDYQPTPGEVAPREKAAGIAPPPAQQKATDQTLETLDKNLMRQEGLSPKSVPRITPGQ